MEKGLASRTVIILAAALFLGWTAATWVLEGRIETLLRPDAVWNRIIYTLIANLLVGVLGAVALLRLAKHSGLPLSFAGFKRGRPSVLWIGLALAAGAALLVVLGAPRAEPVVLANAYAQVLPVSVAEVLVCWSVVGGTARWSLPGNRVAAAVMGALVASALFGIYHFAHSPPFDTVPMVLFLSGVGLITSAFFFISRDAYATIVFHNFLGTVGVLKALAEAGELVAYAGWRLPVVVLALLVVAVLVTLDAAVIRGQS